MLELQFPPDAVVLPAFTLLGLQLEAIVIDPEHGLALRITEIEGVAGLCALMNRLRLNDLESLGPGDALTALNGFSDHADRDLPLAIIQRTIQAWDMPFVIQNPAQDFPNFFSGPQVETIPPERSPWTSKTLRGAPVPSLPTPGEPSDMIHETG